MRKERILRLAGISFAAAAVMAAAFSVQAFADETRTLRYGYAATNSDVLPGLAGIALQQGYFEEELGKVGAEIEPVPFAKAGPAINQALASSEIDVGNLGDVPAAVAKANGAETVLIDAQPSDYSTHLVIRSDLDISEVSELKGHTVAVQTGSYMQRILYQILEANGLSPDDIELVNMSEVDAANAIVSGSVDATVLTELKGVTLEIGNNAKLLYDTDGISEFARITSWVARTEYAEENGDVLTAYFKALERAQEYVKENPESLREIYIQSGTDEELIDIVYPTPEDYCTTVGATEETLNNYQAVVQFLKDYELIDTEFAVSDWYDGSFYEASLTDAQ